MTMLRRIFAPCSLLLVLIMAGCGGESSQTPFTPDSTLVLPRVVAFEPVPTDLVIAVDVSDSTSADALSATVDALISTLGDANVFDPAGSASIAIVVYGDTTATIVDPLTVLDADAVTHVFAPALNGLLADRGVGGGMAVLDEALDVAAALLATGAAGNAHVLIVGGGQDADSAALSARCDVFATSGVRVHAVGLDASDDGAALLAECATATGGSFVNAGDVAAAMRTVLARVTVVQLRLLPDTAEVDRGAGHTTTARVTRGLGEEALPLAGLDVIFEVTTGPSAGATDTVATDAMGEASYLLSGDVPPGTDTIVARVAHPDGDVILNAAVTVTWLNQAPVCAAEGPYAATVEGDTVRVVLDASASSDPENDPLSFLWSVMGEGLALVDADRAVAELIVTGAATCADTIAVALAISDGFDTTECVVRVVLEDGRAPVIVAKSEILELWSPNHKMITVTPDMVLEGVEDACGDLGLEDVVVLTVTSDEAFDARGSGRTSPDVVIGCDGSVQLRAERAGGGDGRVYTIEYAVTDADGHRATLLVPVHVPHDQSGRSAVDSGIVETVIADCPGEEF